MRASLGSLLLGALLLGTLGCGMKVGQLRAGTAAKKDCAACEKMCSVAGDAENNPDAVAACKADCKKTCSN